MSKIHIFFYFFVEPKYDRNVTLYAYLHRYTKKMKAVIKANQRNYTNHNQSHQETETKSLLIPFAYCTSQMETCF